MMYGGSNQRFTNSGFGQANASDLGNSFMDASPIEEAQNRFKSLNINPNYSID